MRPWMLIVLAIICGAAMGLGATFAELGPSPMGNVEAAFKLGLNGSDGPKAVIDEEEFKFGIMELNARDEHDFRIRNEGKEPLELHEGGVSCGLCTEESIAKTKLQPGEETTVQVRWHANKQGPFHQSAWVSTNDPARPRLTFNISGKVLFSHRVDPPELVFSSVSPKESQTADLSIFSYRDGQLAVNSIKFSDKETADKFEANVEPMSKEKLAEDADAKSGIVAHVTVKPGLPLGTLRQKIELQLNLDGEPTVEVPITGNVVSDVAVMGRNWDSDRSLLRLDTVTSAEGAKADLFLQLHGPNAKQLQPKVIQVSPKDELQVTIGKPVDLQGGLVRVPITIEIPRGTRPVSHLGGDEGKLGEVMIDTGETDGEKVRIRVRYAVSQ